MKQLIGYLITISILLSQDILTTKAGNVYEGNLISHTTGDVDFISKGVHHSLPTSMVQRLVLEDGTVLIREGKQFGKFRLTFEEYQKLRVKEKAIYDAKSKHLNHWYLYGSISTIIFSGNYFWGSNFMDVAPKFGLTTVVECSTLLYLVIVCGVSDLSLNVLANVSVPLINNTTSSQLSSTPPPPPDGNPKPSNVFPNACMN